MEVRIWRGFHSPAACRPQGLITLSATCSFQAPASLFSCRRRSWDFRPSKLSPLERASMALPPGHPRLPFLPAMPPTLARRPVLPSRSSRVFTLRESLATGRVISAPPAGCSPGLPSLSGRSRNSLERDSSRPPLTRFLEQLTNESFTGVPEFQSALAWPSPNLMPEHRQNYR